MYYIVTWKDGHKSRFFTWDSRKAHRLIWNYKVANVRVDENQDDDEENGRKKTMNNKEKLNDVIHNIGWVEEYIEMVGEEHKQAYIDGLEYALKLIREIADEIT